MRPRPCCEDLDRQDLDRHERPWRFIVLHACTAGEAGLVAALFPHLAGLDVARVEDTGEGVQITARTATVSLACRGCAVVSARVHDRYWRRLADLGCGGRPVRVVLQVRRFRCGNPACPVKTFAEQVPGLTAWYQRRTCGLRGLLEKVALALAGRAGSRLAAVLGAAVSRFTLIRMIRALPDREADTFAGWLRAHPGTEVLCRDRSSAYARAARDAAPVAVQVADRFHLMQNLGEAVEKTVVACLAGLSPPPGPDRPQDPAAVTPADPPAPAGPDGFRDVNGRDRTLVARHRERYAQVQELRAQGCTIREIASRLDLNQDTARKFANAGSIGELLVKATSRVSILDPFKPCLNQRWNDGIRTAAVLHQEIRAQGWTGSLLTVERYLRQFRTADGRDRQARAEPQLTAPGTAPLR